MVNGDVFVIPNNSSSGFSFVNYHHDLDSLHNSTNGAVWYDEPMLRPSWQMSMWLGNFDKQLYSVYTRTLYYSLGLYSFSDRRLKSNITKWRGSSLNKLMNINVYRYDLDISKFGKLPEQSANKLKAESKNQIGFMAQEIQEEFPELVRSANDDGYLAVNYVGLIPVLLESIKEQQLMIEQLEERIKVLEEK